MLGQNIARRIVALLGASAVVACPGQSPVSFDAADDPVASLPPLSQAGAGSYQLSFFKNGPSGLEPVSSLPVLSDELILGVHVADQFGIPAQRGAVIVQYCSLKALPPNDINRADEAPSQNCEDGSATWANLGSASVDASGNAYLDFGVVMIPRVVGFRCRYLGQGSAIANGVCAPMDFTWTP
jgi:hypothetical protein